MAPMHKLDGDYRAACAKLADLHRLALGLGTDVPVNGFKSKHKKCLKRNPHKCKQLAKM